MPEMKTEVEVIFLIVVRLKLLEQQPFYCILMEEAMLQM